MGVFDDELKSKREVVRACEILLSRVPMDRHAKEHLQGILGAYRATVDILQAANGPLVG